MSYIVSNGMKLKTSKSASKRFKLSKSGKLSHRATHMNHYNAKETGQQGRNKKGDRQMNTGDTKNMKKLMPYL